MNIFQKLSIGADLSPLNHATADVHALLALSIATYSGSDTYSHPVREAVRRWRAAGVGEHYITKLEAFFNTVGQKYAN